MLMHRNLAKLKVGISNDGTDDHSLSRMSVLTCL